MPVPDEDSASAVGSRKSKHSTPLVILVPWDPDSQQHIDRLFGQRVACGWKSEDVEKWRPLQRKGKMAISWIVFSETGDGKEVDAMLAKHISAYPSEKTPLTDSALSFGGKPRTPHTPPRAFIPVGHLSIDSQHEDSSLVDADQGLYCLTGLYVTKALQGTGLGRAAMDAAESMAAGEPLHAKMLSLDTMAREHYREDDPIWEARGTPVPPAVTQDWYARRGYQVYGSKIGWYTYLADGTELPVTAVNMKKSIAQ